MTSTPVLLLLVCTGAVAWLLAAASLVALLVLLAVHAVRRAVRPNRGRHRALSAEPGTAVEDEAAVLVEHSGLSVPHLCPAEERPTLHHVLAAGARQCWVCGTISKADA
ncbi:hypothetical protein [Streptomyces mobaraensis]|uniref:Uncharacterized protein n=1 Tax=Streptomyces mobaraensis TaxID=35621 RepID=A0A5N5WCX7_STRMB|nr:hypothetical protein [Streptomyces mobaraensis]KAB7850188.1 hypothetical protein FRZ00_06210 [Streptomyces mobaraensis]